MNEIFKEFNNQEGRFNRYKFWVYTLVLQVILFLLIFGLSFLGGMFNMVFLVKLASFGGGLGMLYVSFTAYIKRLHDLDKSGWMSLLMFVPLVNIYLFIICGFFKGTDGANKYGANPLITK